jgi:hypothetical protein
MYQHCRYEGKNGITVSKVSSKQSQRRPDDRMQVSVKS